MKGEITRYFRDKYDWHPRPPQPGNFDLCYDLPHGSYTYPSMTYHFAGADLFLDDKNVFQFFHGGFCLIMLPINDGGTNLLGAFQQANRRFLFDFRAFTASLYQKCVTSMKNRRMKVHEIVTVGLLCSSLRYLLLQ